MIDASIVIVSYNSREYTERCLKSIYDNVKGLSFEVICVDNGSKDGSADMIRKKFPQVVLYESRLNIGYSRGNNLGLRMSAGRYAVLLNRDTVILPGALETVIEFMERNRDAGAASPKLLNPDGSIQYCVRTLPDIKTAVFQSLGWHKLFPRSRITARYYRTDLDYEKVLSVDSIGTTCYAIRREVLERVGFLDEAFFMYNVDLDYNKRIKDAGFNIYYLPEARIIHYGGISVNQNNIRGLKEQHQGMWLMYKKHYSPRRPPVTNAFVYAAIRMRLSAKLLLALISSDKRVIKGPGAPRSGKGTAP